MMLNFKKPDSSSFFLINEYRFVKKKINTTEDRKIDIQTAKAIDITPLISILREKPLNSLILTVKIFLN